jgi:hypothetical protein
MITLLDTWLKSALLSFPVPLPMAGAKWFQYRCEWSQHAYQV